MQDIGKAFTYMFEDENWVTKILLGGVFILLSVILIGIPFWVGYMVEIVQNVLAGRPKPLPEWTNLGDKFIKGLILVVAIIIWLIPSFILSGIGSGFQAAAGPRGGGGLVAIGFLFSCLSTIYSILFYLILPAIFIKYAQQPDFGSAFKINDFISMITGNIGNYIVVLVLSIVAHIIAAFGLIALCIGFLFTSFWAYLVSAHLYGQLGRAAGITTPTTTS